MFKWLKGRQRNEHLKLVKQNELAERYLEDFVSTAIEIGMGGDPYLLETLQLALAENLKISGYLDANEFLPPEVVSSELTMNKNLRRLYDEVLMGKKMVAQKFGAASERLLPFDQRFTPNEGWNIFYAHRKLNN